MLKEVTHAIFSGMKILYDERWLDKHALLIENNKIKAIIPEDMIEHHLPAIRYEYPADHYLIPGLIDLHIHGAVGHDVMDGSEEGLHAISHALAAEGVTGFLATTLSADAERLDAVLKIIKKAMVHAEGAAILGVHLEGPFIAKEKMGAQPEASIQLPDISLIEQWQSLTKGAIKVVTLAPELPGALEFIEALSKMDVVASMGHTNASYAQAVEAIAAGCTQATHLFNAMSGIHQREPGVVTAVLLSHRVMAELIVDGIHLHPAIVELVLSMKGKETVLLVTDAMRAKCLGDGAYDLGGQSVTVKTGKATLQDGTLAGSTLRMPEAIKHMVQYTRCPLEDAIAMASYNPARVLGLSARKGSIEVGKDADLAVLDKDLAVQLTIRAGKSVFVKS